MCTETMKIELIKKVLIVCVPGEKDLRNILDILVEDNHSLSFFLSRKMHKGKSSVKQIVEINWFAEGQRS